MGKFFVWFAVGFGAAVAVNYLRRGSAMGQLHRGFIPLETPRSTLANSSPVFVGQARIDYATRGISGGGLGNTDYLLT